MFNRLSDDELVRLAEEALARAHDAPKSDVLNPSHAWADRSREWMALANEVERRGLKA